ncbi:MAG TPA: S-methyl-5'-thioadenosine phosphorylase [Sphingomonadaceae bacterium]|nr:S-methyl-5'-thioadenosine phosphorylase [Sphingomonadaceae bacterium]
MSAQWHIGVVGGTGLYDADILEDAQQIPVQSSFGEPSGPVTTGRIGDVRFTFMPRHGIGHSIPPDRINYRANIEVLKRCGVTDIVSVSAIGSLREELAPGEFVLVDQLIDRTVARESSFFGTGLVAHVSFADPVCPRLSDLVAAAATKSGARLHKGGCYVAIEGPQFSTRAESRMYREWGADVIGMTAMPEARLAREAELPYALLAMVTDYDSWRDAEEGADVAQILKVLHANSEKARKTLVALAGSLPEQREPSPIETSLDGAILTAPERRDPDKLIQLRTILSRVNG